MHLSQRDEGVWVSEVPINRNQDAMTSSEVISIPLISRTELAELSDTQKAGISGLDLSHIYPLGVDNRYYTIVVWNAGYLFRKKTKLSSHPLFCVPLTGSHVPPPDIYQVTRSINIDGCDPQVLDHLTFALLHAGYLALASQAAISLCEKAPQTEKGWLRLGDVGFKMERYKLAMLAYGRILQLQTAPQKLTTYCIERITSCSMHTEWGQVFLDKEMEQIPTALSAILLEPWTSVREMFRDAYAGQDRRELQLGTHLRLSATVPPNAPALLPRFFQWIVPFQVALSSTPTSEDEVTQLISPTVGIRHIISLDDRNSPWTLWLQGKPIKHTLVTIPDLYPPSIEQLDCIMEILLDPANLPALIHCAAGLRRTGTIAACYITAFGFQAPRDGAQIPVMQASEAINALRAIRPGSIETSEQEGLVAGWANAVWKRKSIVPPALSEPAPCPLEIVGNVPPDADLLVLVGLQGSGKSWFARALRARDPKSWNRISQDESGSRSISEKEIGRDPYGKRVILDRCNPNIKDRIYWRRLAHWAKRPILVWFDYSSDLCISRAQKRLDHPTLPPGSRVRMAISSTTAQFEAPFDPAKEGFSGAAIVRSFKASQELVALLSPPIQLFKFPRTPHLLDLGAATIDDLVEAPGADSQTPLFSTLDERSQLVITEKIDGANLGISLDADGRIVVQNRSHWVNSKTHFQFKRLDLWVEENREGLYHILARDKAFMQRYILFGEWLVCMHAIHYSRLPNHFLAFDLYDRSTGTFASREVMQGVVDGTGIHVVPVLETRNSTSGKSLTIPSPDELRGMVQRPSNYYDGRVEGVYVKVERDGKVIRRGKVVRGDFIAGNEHWTRGDLTLNGIIRVGQNVCERHITKSSNRIIQSSVIVPVSSIPGI